MSQTLQNYLANQVPFSSERLTINIVALIDGNYFSIFEVRSGLVIPPENLILSNPKISGINFDLRKVTTPIGTFGFQLTDAIASLMLTTPGSWLQTPVTLYVGEKDHTDWADYLILMSGIITSITAVPNGFTYSCKEILNLTFKDFERKTTLRLDILTTETSIPVDDTANFQDAGVIKIDKEFIGYTSKTATTIDGCTRGIFGTTAANHSTDTFVYSDYHFLNINPIDIMLELMLSIDGNGANGPYDVLQFGMAIPQSSVDVAKFESIRDEFFVDAKWSLEVFNIGNFLTYMETEFLQPLNCRFVTVGGLISLAILDNFTAAPLDPPFNEDVVVATPTWKIGSDKIVNNVQVEYAYDFATEEYTAQRVFEDTTSINLYGRKNPLNFAFKGIADDTDGNALLSRLIEKFLLRLSKSRGSIQAKTFYSAYNIPLGGNVFLSHRYVPKVGQGMGANEILEAISKSIDLETGNVTFDLEFMSTADFRVALIGPTSTITIVIDQTKFEVDDISLFKVGYRIELMDTNQQYYPDPYRTIIAINGNEVTIDAPFDSTILVPDIKMKMARYDFATPQMKTDCGYISPTVYTNITPTMTGPTTPAGYEVTVSNEDSPTSVGWMAYANDGATTAWETVQQTSLVLPQWNALEFPDAVNISKYVIQNKTGADVYSPRDWLIEGSNDGAIWTAIDSRSDQLDNVAGSTREYFVGGTSLSYKHLRIFVTRSNGGAVSTTYQTAVGELTYYKSTATNFPDGGPPYVIIY